MAYTPVARQVIPSLTVGNCLQYEACVLIDGRLLSRSEPLWGFRTTDVELVELYGVRNDPLLLRGFGAVPCTNAPTVVVWQRPRT
jgi:hypothetical protein